MKKILARSAAALVMSIAGIIAARAQESQEPHSQRALQLRETFAAADSHAARPQVWWHWVDGNVSKEGIRQDLLWMKRVGIGGFHQFDVGLSTPPAVEKPLMYMSHEWKEHIAYAMSLADSLDLDITICSSPGWCFTGGIWVESENAMKKIVWRKLETDGGKGLELKFEEPITELGTWMNVDNANKRGKPVEPWYQDIAVVAVKLSDKDRTIQELGATLSSSNEDLRLEDLCDGDYFIAGNLPLKEGGAWVQYEFPEAVEMRSVHVSCTDSSGTVMMLQCSGDGVNYTDIAGIPDSELPAVTVDFAPTTAKYFRLKITGGEKAGTRKIREFTLSPVYKVHRAEAKAGFCRLPAAILEFNTPASEDAGQTIVLPGTVGADGSFSCDLPEGRWRLYRMGATLTGMKNIPSPTGAKGLEVDKLDKDATREYFRYYFSMMRDAAGGLLGERGIQYVLTDSYECGCLNWTENMREEFRKRRGYALEEWLPCLAGEVVGSSEETEKFLWDWRSTIGELFTESYSVIDEVVKEFGMKGRYSESHESKRAYIGDGMDPKITATVPMGAIWATNGKDLSTSTFNSDIKESSSVAHLFGQKIVTAESFSARGMFGKAYSFCPENLKFTADVALSMGLNRFTIHESASQPNDEHLPGPALWEFGQWFTRHETWAEMAKPWLDYLARSCYLLQQGSYVADILVYYGEDNNITNLYSGGLPVMPEGISFDFVNPTGLLEHIRFENGAFVAPSGASYKVLVLGENCKRMSLAALRKIAEFASHGAFIQGRMPEGPASLLDDENEFNALVKEIWDSPNVSSGSLSELAAKAGLKPDFLCSTPDVHFVHRRLPDGDIYWFCNFGETAANASVRLKEAKGGSLSLWDAVSGTYSSYVDWTRDEDGSVNVQLDLPAGAAYFLVSDNGPAPVPSKSSANPLKTINGPWNLSFSGLKAPESVEMDLLSDLSESSDPQLKYFSGLTTYGTGFKLSKAEIKKADGFRLNLGTVKNVAEVFVNGQSCGITWKTPFSVEIPAGVLKAGENELKIVVANLWPNRIIGDAQTPEERCTYIAYDYYSADAPLLPSGLLGPVTLEKFSVEVE